MGKIILKCETITPLFTGDCNQEMTEIKPASIMGSLRFWFDVICHFSGEFNNKKYLKNEFDAKKYSSFIKNKPDATDEDIQKYIQKELCLSPTAFYFGCTGWKSQIGIEKIEKIYKSTPAEIGKKDFTSSELVDSKKENPNVYGRKISLDCGKNDEKGNSKKSRWFLPQQYFWGKFQITFSLSNKDLKDNILFPLLSFIQEYGFLGGKNNIGFGRVKILKGINTQALEQNKNFNFNILHQTYALHVNRLKKTDYHIGNNNYQKFDDKCIGITYLPLDKTSKNYMNNIKRLLKVKSLLRDLYVDDEKKQKLFFGSAKKDQVQATKIIPLIREKERGFLAIPRIISMEEKNNGTK